MIPTNEGIYASQLKGEKPRLSPQASAAAKPKQVLSGKSVGHTTPSTSGGGCWGVE